MSPKTAFLSVEKWRLSVLLLATSLQCHAATLSWASLKPAMERSHIPDVAVAVFNRCEVQSIFCSSSSRPVSPDAIFEAASLSKPVFALGVLRLVQEGSLNLDRPLAEYLDHPYEHQQNPFAHGATDAVLDPQFSAITARMVLSHTSGLPNWSHHGPLLPVGTPGSKWSYSGEGYVYLQHVVEAITQKPVEVFLQEEILIPLGMMHSSFVWRPDYATVALSGHSASGETMPIGEYAKPVVSSTLYTTLGDYSRFVAQLLHPDGRPPILS